MLWLKDIFFSKWFARLGIILLVFAFCMFLTFVGVSAWTGKLSDPRPVFGTAVCRYEYHGMHCSKGCMSYTDYFLVDQNGNKQEVTEIVYNSLTILPICDRGE
jgi:hypothetical protein